MKYVMIIKGKYSGQEFKGHRFLFDHLHTGSSPDLFTVKTPDGEITITSDEIDVAHYDAQLLEEQLNRLGARVGDTVKIIRSGSGSYRSGWDGKVLHKITKITPSGYVQFDDGMAEMFRPDIEVINMDGLIVKPKWGELILSGLKTWEIRGSNTSHRGRHYLIESGTNMVYGEFDIVDSQPLTEEDFNDHIPNHMLPVEMLYSDLLKIYKKPYRWVIENARKYETPIHYKHPQGAVIWVKDVKFND